MYGAVHTPILIYSLLCHWFPASVGWAWTSGNHSAVETGAVPIRRRTSI